jgi:hypothetical protein
MIARLLNLCGLYLGPREQMVPATVHNQEGYWEHLGFVEINDALLTMCDAGWDYPPDALNPWSAMASASLRTQAKRLVDDFSLHEPWGWKDPRTSLTLAFWMDVVPQELKVVVPIRHPLEVAASLHRRNDSSFAFSLRLWVTYHQRLLALTSRAERVVTHYDAYFHHPEKELQRLLDLLGMSASQGRVVAATGAVASSLRHNRFRDSRYSAVGLEATRLYLSLCEEACWYDEGFGRLASPGVDTSEELGSRRLDLERTLERAMMNVERPRRLRLMPTGGSPVRSVIRDRLYRILRVEKALAMRDLRIRQLQAELEALRVEGADSTPNSDPVELR